MEIDRSFSSLLAGAGLDVLDAEGGAVYGLWPDLRIGLLSRGWVAFAEDNGGAAVLASYGVGASIQPAIPAPLVPFYRAAYASALAGGEPWQHVYECSSPTEFRRFQMTIYGLAGKGFLTVNSLVEERPYPQPPGHPGPTPLDDYLTDGMITQCAHCGRFRRAAGDGSGSVTWAWAGAWLNAPPAPVSHGLCAPCLEYHYPRGA